MAYSTQTQLENNVEWLEESITDATERGNFATDRIALADKIIDVCLDKYVDLSSADENVKAINLLSQYKSAEMTLRRLLGVKHRREENDDITEWARLFEELKDDIINGSVVVEDSSGNSLMTGVSSFTADARQEIKPFFGYDRYGFWIDDEDLKTIRGDVDDSTLIERGQNRR